MKKLRGYQVDGVHYLRKNNGGALFEEMRLGKTIQVIRYVKQLKPCRVLVLAPYEPLEGWKEELLGDGVDPSSVNLWYDTTLKRTQRLHDTQSDIGWFLFNKEAPLRIPLELFKWSVLILDESVFISNPKAKITQWALSMAKKVPIRIILTGTPAPESPLQYFCQLRFVNENALPYRHYWEYRAKCFRPTFEHDFAMSLAARKELGRALNEHCYILSRKDVGLFKEKIYEKRYVQLSSENRKLYRQAEKDWCIGETVYKFAGARWNAMRVLCGREEKLKSLCDLLKTELAGKKVIVWAWYVTEVLDISVRLKCPHICGLIPKEKRPDIRKDFLKSGSVLVAQPETWKVGTNLTGVDAVVFYTSPCGLYTRSQVEERTVDLMTSGATLIIDLVCKDTLEEDILAGLIAKESEILTMERIRKNVLSRIG